jgi:hypothetical protein
MKVIVRSLVIALAVTGAAATTFANAAPAPKAGVTASKTSAMPVPRCMPDDPNGCNIGW